MTVQDVEDEAPARGLRRPLSFGTKAFYGVGSVANGAYGALGGLAMFFYSQVVGVPPHIVSLAISAVIFIDGFWDPLIGHGSDQFRSRIGRRHPFLYLAMFLVPVAIFLRWHPPGWDASAMFWYILGTGLFVNLAWSLYEIPSGAMAPELAPDYHDRTVLLGYRWMLGSLGTALATVFIYGIFLRKTPEHPVGQLNADGYGPLSIAIILIFLVAGLTMALGTQKQAAGFHQPPREPGRTFREDWRDALVTLTNRNFLVALSAQVIAGLAFGIAAGLGLYFQTYLWELKAQDILILTLMGLPGPIFGGILAPRLARRFGKKKAAMVLHDRRHRGGSAGPHRAAGRGAPDHRRQPAQQDRQRHRRPCPGPDPHRRRLSDQGPAQRQDHGADHPGGLALPADRHRALPGLHRHLVLLPSG